MNSHRLTTTSTAALAVVARFVMWPMTLRTAGGRLARSAAEEIVVGCGIGRFASLAASAAKDVLVAIVARSRILGGDVLELGERVELRSAIRDVGRIDQVCSPDRALDHVDPVRTITAFAVAAGVLDRIGWPSLVGHRTALPFGEVAILAA